MKMFLINIEIIPKCIISMVLLSLCKGINFDNNNLIFVFLMSEFFFNHSLHTIVILSQNVFVLQCEYFSSFFIVISYLTIVNLYLTVTSCSCLNFISIIMVTEIPCIPI